MTQLSIWRRTAAANPARKQAKAAAGKPCGSRPAKARNKT
jgi:hypothetical protein